MTSAAIQGALPALRDIVGVQGSFVTADEGAVLARDLPAFVDDGVLTELAPRFLRLYENLSAGGDYLETCVLTFEQQKLVLRRLPGGFLCLVATEGVNQPALRMAMNLVARRIHDGIRAELVAEARSNVPATVRPPPRASAPAPPARPTPAPPQSSASPRPARVYRGTPVR